MYKLILDDKVLCTEIIYSRRKTIGIYITKEQTIQVRAPYFTSKQLVQEILYEKKNWIAKTLSKLEMQKQHHIKEFSEEDQKEYREKARKMITEKVKYYSCLMNVSYNRIAIKDQKTCFGSCSKQGNLNFNWRLILMPEEILDYVVIHELAHLKEMNHSSAFWKLVEEILPDYKTKRKWLKEQGAYFMRQ